MAALIREPPRDDGPTRRVSLRASVDELDVSAIARKSRRRRPPPGRRASRARVGRRDHRASSVARVRAVARHVARRGAAAAAVASRGPRADRRSSSSTSRPGPSSFAIVARAPARAPARARATRERSTRSRPGSLLLLSGRATKLAPCFVGLDKRYLTEVDLHGADVDGRPGGRGRRARTSRRARHELEARLAGLRGEIELPIPAASAVKIGGERAYRLRRRGVAVEMPLRRSTVYALDVIAYTTASVGRARPARRARARTCARSRTRSAGTAGRCGGRRSGRSRSRRPRLRSAVDAVEAAARHELEPCSAARRRAPARDGRARIAGGAASAARRARSRSGPSTACTSGTGACSRRRSRPGCADGRHVRPAPARRARHRVELLTTLERRLELLAEAASRTRSSSSSRRSSPRSSRRTFAERVLRAIGAEVVVAGDGLPLRPRPRAATSSCSSGSGFDVRPVPLVEGVSSSRDPRAARARATSRGAAALLGRPAEVEGIVVAGDAARRHARLPDREPRRRRGPARARRYGIYAGAALGHRRARSRSATTRTTAATSGGSRRSCSTSRATSTAAARRRALGAAPRRARVRERGGARRADRARRRATRAAVRPG